MLNQMIYAGQKVQGLESGFNVINPATEAVLTVCKSASINQVNDAVESAKQAFQTWKNTEFVQRIIFQSQKRYCK